MKPLSTISGLLFFIFVFDACKEGNTKNKTSNELLKYAKEKGPGLNIGTGTYSIAAPAGWNKIDTSLNGIEVTFITSPPEDSSDDFHENVNVVTENVMDFNLEEYFEKSVSMVETQLQGFVKGSIGEMSINGLKAKTLSYSFTMSGENLSIKEIFLVNNKTGYVITCTAKKGFFAKWEPVFDEVVNSFRIK